MKKLFSTFALSAVTLLLASNANTQERDLAAKATEVIIYNDAEYRPYSYVENNAQKGIYIDFLQEIDKRMPDFTLKIRSARWHEARSEIEQGNAFAIMGTYFHGKERPGIYPYSMPIFQEEVVLVCGEDAVTAEYPSFPAGFEGVTIAHTKGYDGWLRKRLRNAKNTRFVKFFEVPNINVALTMVVKSRLDCATFEKKAFASTMKYLETKGKYSPETDTKAVIKAVLARESVFLGFSEMNFHSDKYPWADSFKKQFDFAVFEMQENGDIANILDNYSSVQ